MNENERGIFSLMHGISGMLVATVLLLSILAVLTYLSITTQVANATNTYEVNQDINGLKFIADSKTQYENRK
ncbi:MAG: hypothetical protein B1H07_02285 [Campylobacteraceae bacterium 4484_166]|nr:MAG: hypothetical protein B1H07_02285 [Campylobacteraceae bacterium 4484_166]